MLSTDFYKGTVTILLSESRPKSKGRVRGRFKLKVRSRAANLKRAGRLPLHVLRVVRPESSQKIKLIAKNSCETGKTS